MQRGWFVTEFTMTTKLSQISTVPCSIHPKSGTKTIFPFPPFFSVAQTVVPVTAEKRRIIKWTSFDLQNYYMECLEKEKIG